jgi:cell division protein FtsQ
VSAEIGDLGVVRRRHRRQRIIRSSIGLLLLLVALWFVFFSPYLVVKKIEVTGDFYASNQSVLTAASIELNQPLALIDSDGVTRRVLNLSEIINVEIRRVWPDKVIIAVTERTPIAVAVAGTGWTLVDASGVRFGSLTVKPAKLLVVSGPNNIARKEAALIAGQLPQWLTQRVTAIRGYSRDDVRLTLENADVIRWGSSENFKSKIEVIEVLLDLEARIYDVSAPSMPVTRS